MKPTRHIIIDNETLDLTASAALLTIGAIAVEISDSGLIVLGRWYRRIEWKEGQPGRTTTAETHQWWATHPSINLQASWEALGGGHRTPLHIAMQSLSAWLQLNPYPIWGNGSDFDNAQLQHAFTQLGLRWPYWRNCCLRSLRNLVLQLHQSAAIPRFPADKIKHHALHDAEHEADVLAVLLQTLAAPTATP